MGRHRHGVLLSGRWRGDIAGEEDGSVAEVGVVDVVDEVVGCRRRMRGKGNNGWMGVVKIVRNSAGRDGVDRTVKCRCRGVLGRGYGFYKLDGQLFSLQGG